MNESVDLVDSGNDLVVIILSLVGARTVLDLNTDTMIKALVLHNICLPLGMTQ